MLVGDRDLVGLPEPPDLGQCGSNDALIQERYALGPQREARQPLSLVTIAGEYDRWLANGSAL